MGVGGAAPFVGREAERRALMAVVHRAAASAGSVAVLTGAAGIGKTRLADEVARAAAGTFDVAWASCGQAGTMPPYWPWTQVIGDLVNRHPDLRRRAEQQWPAALALVDRRRSAAGAAGAAEDHAQARAELYEDVVALLAAAATAPGRPQLIVLDDLHNADPSSWSLLAHVAPRLRSVAVAVLATWRTGEVRVADPASTAVLRTAQAVPVPPLGIDDVASLLGGGVDAEVATAVHRRTSGNPLLTQEILAALADRDALVDAGTVAAAIPESTRALVAERRARLPASSVAVLATAAALGTDFALDVMAEAVGRPVSEILDALSPAVAAGVLRALDAGGGTFAHDLVRDVLLELEPAASRAAAHGRIADALDRLAARGRAVEPADRARHLLAAGPSFVGRAAVAATAAGDRAMAMLAYEEAAVWYRQAAAAMDTQAAGPADRAQVLLSLGEAAEASGDRAGARRTYLAAAAAARAASRSDLLAAAALGVSGTVGFEVALLDQEQIDLLREALDALPADDQARRASVMARLTVAVSGIETVEARAELAQHAVALARASGDRATLVQALAAQCDAIAGPEHTGARVVLAAEVVAVGRELHDARLELLGRRLLVVAHLERGDLAAADREILAFGVTAAALRRPVYSWYVPLWRAMRAEMEGRLDDAGAALAEAQGIGTEAGSENAFLLTTTLHWYLLDDLGDLDRMAALLAGSGLETIPATWALVTRAMCATQLGRPDEARTLLDAAAGRLPRAERDSEWLPMLAQAAAVVRAIGTHPVAAWAYDALLPHRALFAVEGIGAVVRCPVEHALGLLAASLGRADEARAHFEAAVAASERIGAALLVARARRDAGLSAAPPEPVPAGGVQVFRPEGDVWQVRYGGFEVRVRDSKGVRDLARLVASPGRAIAAVDLAGPAAGTALVEGDLGELVDATARQAYRRRLAELDEEIDDADRAADIERSARAVAEKDALVAHLAAAYGLGGRARRTGDPAEKARQAVTARIRDAIGRIEAVHPELGRHLRHSVRTGRICAYEPESAVDWTT